MSFVSRAYKVFIASPSDVYREREVIKATIMRWNSINSEHCKIVLIPIDWETNAAPEMGQAAQDYINMDILDTCDIVIGVFWTKVGTPTRNHISGSIEEVLRPSANRLLTMLYFSNKVIEPRQIDATQYAKLGEFKEKVRNQSLYCEFSDERDLEEKIYQHIQIKMNEGKLRSRWDSDIVAAIQDDTQMAKAISGHFPQVAENVLKKILYEEHADIVWDAIVEKLTTAPSRLSDTLLYIARSGACDSVVFREGCKRLSQEAQVEFCTFLNNLYSVNKYEFWKLFRSDLLTDKAYKERLELIVRRDEAVNKI